LTSLICSGTETQWDTPSLCAGWRVREVIAHMTMAARYPQDQFMAELRRCDFDFGRLSNEIASRDAELPLSSQPRSPGWLLPAFEPAPEDSGWRHPRKPPLSPPVTARKRQCAGQGSPD
jgi:uncharacterized protein (TIGR03083 family)